MSELGDNKTAPADNLAPPGIIARVEAARYRSLLYVSQRLRRFHALVGPNASGKSTLLDVFAFVGDILRGGLVAAIEGDVRLGIPFRAPDGKHLTWMRSPNGFELAIEATVPPEIAARVQNGSPSLCRYELAIDVSEQPQIRIETLWLIQHTYSGTPEGGMQRLFPDPDIPTKGVVIHRRRAPEGWRKVVSRGESPEQVRFQSETSGWGNPFRIRASEAALANLPEDAERFPVATWLRRFLTEGIQRVVLSAEHMRRPSPPSRVRGYLPDGSNLPHAIHELKTKHPARFQRWIDHLREALPNLHDVSTHEREEDRHRYLIVHYKNGDQILDAPSWLVSDGTLRMLALTLLAYLPDLTGVYLIEEPENGIHPQAIEPVIQSLSSVYSAQVLLATHSPVVLSTLPPSQILCFALNPQGATDVISGDEHPRLREWKGTSDLGTLLAAGVLS
ncbi:MAG: ATP-binding protein [Anaerolineae bacterium]|nr:ATP-binding protein [Thermoflexales bacterium]MDW8395128.1 ATP-binding protein [Anaerolineae bacterium]